jgi:hypothetical protein
MGSGLNTQFMAVDESAVGTAVTVTRGYEVHSLTPVHGKITQTSSGLRAGARGHRARNRVKTGVGATLSVPMTVMSKGFGLWLKHMMGTSTSAQIDSTATYRQIHVPGDLTGKSLTTQGGFAESYTSNVRAYTYNGCKITDWELACNADDLLEATITLDAWNWTTATSLASASYLSALEEYHWALLAIKIGGTASTTGGRTTVSSGTALKGCRGVSLKGTTGLRTDRRVAGGGGVKIEQIENDFRAYTGDLDLEFADRTQVMDLVDADTTTVLQFEWTGVTDDGDGNFPVLRATYPAVKFEPAQPEAGGPDVVDGKVTFTAFEDDASSNPLIQLEYESQDTTI